MEYKKKKLFLDFDGTLAEFKNVGPDIYSAKGYSRNLEPLHNVVKAAKMLYESGTFELFLLSAVLPYDHCIADKNIWLDVHLPELKAENRIYSKYGDNKYEALVKSGIIVESGDIFLDDYTKNLIQMDNDTKLLTSVKLLNGINDTNKSWYGLRVSSASSAKDLSRQLKGISIVAIRDSVA